MTAYKKRVVSYLVFMLLGGICVYLSGLIAGFAAYQNGNGPPSGVGKSNTIAENEAVDIAVNHINKSIPEYSKISEKHIVSIEYNKSKKMYEVFIDVYPKRTGGGRIINIDARTGKVLSLQGGE